MLWGFSGVNGNSIFQFFFLSKIHCVFFERSYVGRTNSNEGLKVLTAKMLNILQVYTQVHKICTWFTAYQAGTFLLACILFNAVPAFTNYRNGLFETLSDPVNATYELSLYFKLPFDPERSFKSYCYSLALNWYERIFCFSQYDRDEVINDRSIYNAQAVLLLRHIV